MSFRKCIFILIGGYQIGASDSALMLTMCALQMFILLLLLLDTGIRKVSVTVGMIWIIVKILDVD